MPSPQEEAFLAAIADAPEDLTPRLVFADWLEEKEDPRAEHLRVHCQILNPETDATARRKLQRLSSRLAVERRLDVDWLVFLKIQERLYRVSRRCRGEPTPVALRVLWREAVLGSPEDDDEGRMVNVVGGGEHRSVALEVTNECKQDRDEYLDNEDIKSAFVRMFKEIDFVGCDNSGAVFGFWRFEKGLTIGEAPVVYLDQNADFTLTGATLQDHFALPDVSTLRTGGQWEAEHQERFEQARAWFEARGVATSPSLEALGKAMERFPSPEERFSHYCERCQ